MYKVRETNVDQRWRVGGVLMRTLDTKTLTDFVTHIQSHIPGFRVGYKDQSRIMKILGFLSAPFNPRFMDQYTTTWGKTVFFPTEAYYLENPARSFHTLTHEFVHLWDGKEHPWSFPVSYVFPQVLFVLPLLAYAGVAWPHGWVVLLPILSYVLSCSVAKYRVAFWGLLGLLLGASVSVGILLTGWWTFLLAGAFVFLAPWPAPWRVKWELRGYGMDVSLFRWIRGGSVEPYLDVLLPQFTGPSYFYMSWSSAKVLAAFLQINDRVKSGEIRQDPPYRITFDFLQVLG